ncbi:hypothetical protein [Rhizobium sp. BK176]|uniref:hypothetical protein n=1 Tax=Rhizobium sp. BK176 TaxID=2587071 RepID=UPI0021681D51|nr:hypothetical protein [Rhizobium sp. BK176]MCS4088456.1 hypothetical protein [Rhizobium sp. BK176]
MSRINVGQTFRKIPHAWTDDFFVGEDDRHPLSVVEAMQLHEGRRFAQVFRGLVAPHYPARNLDAVHRKQITPATDVWRLAIRPLHFVERGVRPAHEVSAPISAETSGDDAMGGALPDGMLPIE